MLMKWGPVIFEVFPLNIGEIDHTTGTDWAKKEIAGAAYYREWVGEGDEEIHLRGKLYPYWLVHNGYAHGSRGGISHLDMLDNMRRLGQAHLLIRGDGWSLGWYVMERLSRGHTFLTPEGLGQQITFETVFQRVPVPEASDYFGFFWQASGGDGGS